MTRRKFISRFKIQVILEVLILRLSATILEATNIMWQSKIGSLSVTQIGN